MREMMEDALSTVVQEAIEKEREGKTERKYTSVDVARHAEATIVLPDGMALRTGAAWLRRIDEEQDEFYAVYERTAAHPLDGANALAEAVSRRYGHARTLTTKSFWGNRPPMELDIQVGPNMPSKKVPWGRIGLPFAANDEEQYLETTAASEANRQFFVVRGQMRKRFRDEVNSLLALMKEILDKESIYRGKAIRIDSLTLGDDDLGNPTAGAPSFIDVSGASLDKVVLNREVEGELEDYVLTPIRYPSAAATLGIRRKRGVLLHGPYGTGKTLTSQVIAKVATDNGMTFIYSSNPFNLAGVYRFAMQYSPAVLFVEDVDKVVGGPRSTEMNEVLNILDGIDSKTAEVMTVFTTNELGTIHQAFERPGRIDVIIEINEPDAEAAARLVRLYAKDALDPAANMERIGEALAGNIPAIIAEAVKRAQLSALSRAAGLSSDVKITAEDIERASHSLSVTRKLLGQSSEPEQSTMEKMGRSAMEALVQASS